MLFKQYNIYTGIACVMFVSFILIGCNVNPKNSLSSGFSDLIFVSVDGFGATAETAKQNAFNNAVEQATGLLIVSTSSLSNGILTKDEANTYSSGYIQNYEIAESAITRDGVYHVRINAAVKSSMIKDTFATKRNESGTKFNESNIQATLYTKLRSIYQAEKLLANLLTNFPQNAFVVDLGNSRTRLDHNRTGFSDTEVTIKWSQPYLTALSELLTTISEKKCTKINSRSSLYDCSSQHINIYSTLFSKFTGASYTISDDKILSDLRLKLTSPKYLKISFYSNSGDIFYSNCYDTNLSARYAGITGREFNNISPISYTDDIVDLSDTKFSGIFSIIPNKNPKLQVGYIKGVIVSQDECF